MENCTKIYLSVHYNHYAPFETKTFNESSFVSSSMNEKQRNKAGYTATSCGWVGRGGYVRFPTFQLVLMDGRTKRPTNQQVDKGSCRVACGSLVEHMVTFVLVEHMVTVVPLRP